MDNPNTMTRRRFLAATSCLGAALWAARAFPLPAMAEGIAEGGRVSRQPVADKGFASVRKIGYGAYATISDPSKGLETMSNGGFIVGTEPPAHGRIPRQVGEQNGHMPTLAFR